MLAIYTRFSKDDPESNSSYNQHREGIEFSEKKGFLKEPRLYDEGIGISGGLKASERKELSRLIDDIKNGTISTIWMRNQNRLERNTFTFHLFADVCSTNNIDVYFGDGEKVDYKNPNSILQGSLMSAFNAYQRESQSYNTKKSIRDNFKSGLVHGIPPYGYTKDKHRKMIIHPEESKTVKLIFKLSLEGNGYNAIAKKLNDKDIPTRYKSFAKKLKEQPNYDVERYNTYNSKIWVGGSIQNIIKNEVYKGIRKTKNDEVYILDEPILKSFYYDKVVRHLKENMNNSGKKVEHKYLLNGSCTCGVCDKQFNGRTVKVGTKYLYYQCVTKRKGKNSCGNLMVRLDILDKLIWDIYIKNKHLLDILDVDYSRKGVMKELFETTKKLKILSNQKAQLNLDKEKVIDLILDDTLKKHQVQPRMLAIENDMTMIDEEIYDNMQTMIEYKELLDSSINRNEDFDGMPNITTLEDKQTNIQKYIKNIKVTKTNKNHTLVEIDFKAVNVHSDIIVIDRLYNWYCTPYGNHVVALNGKEITPEQDVQILKSIYEDFKY